MVVVGSGTLEKHGFCYTRAKKEHFLEKKKLRKEKKHQEQKKQPLLKGKHNDVE